MSIRALDKATSRNIHSGQVITDIDTIVKELVENALDAQSTSIEVKLFDNGIEAIYVKDNGKGIIEADRPVMAKRYYTSKIRVFEDISTIYSYGFRGEALNSICTIAKSVVITTKSQFDPIGKIYELDMTGSITCEKLANTIANTGTIIVVNEPFVHQPVRRKMAKKDSNAIVKKIEALLITYGISNPNVRFSLVHHAKSHSWIKPTTNDIEASLRNIYGLQLGEMVERHTITDTQDDHTPLTLDMILPKLNSDPSVIYKGDHVFFFVNGRPINYSKSELTEIVRSMRQYYREAIGLSDAASARKTPFIYIDIQTPPNEYDINIDPNKSTVFFHNKQRIVDLVDRTLKELYPKKIDVFFNQSNKKTRPIESLVTTNSQRQEMTSTSPTVEPMEYSPTTTSPPIRSEQHASPSSSSSNIARTNQVGEPSSSTSEINSWNFTMMDQDTEEEVDQLIDDDPDIDPKGKGRSHPIQNISKSPNMASENIPKPATVTASSSSHLPSSSVSPNNNNSHNDHNRSAPINNNIDSRQHHHSPIQTTLTNSVSLLKPHDPSPSSNSARALGRNTTTTTTTNRKRAYNDVQAHKEPNIASIVNKNPRPSLSEKPTWSTLNNSMMVTCDFESIKKNYEANNEHRARYHHIRINDYLDMNRSNRHSIDSTKHITNLVKHPELHKKGMAFYTRGISPDQPVYELGVLKIDELYSATAYDALIKKHPLVCKRNLERPVQLRIDVNDPLYSVMILLKSKEEQVQDDLHGSKNQTFTVITDKRVLHNGFNCRWRKDDHSDCILVQLTSIYSLGSSYGVSDFRELLTKISLQPYDEENLELTRPQKVADYYQSLSQKKYNSNDETEKMQLNRGLESLNWSKPDQDTNWKIGTLKGKVQACVLTDQ